MYPIRLGFDVAKNRINNLLNNGHYAEALVTTVFTVEKTLRRTLRQIIISAGFKSKDAELLVNDYRSLDALKKHWAIFDIKERTLISLIGDQNWQIIKECAKMRNDLVHGNRVYKLKTCEINAKQLLTVLDNLKQTFDFRYGYSGWTKMKPRKKSVLHSDPKISSN